MGQNITSLSIQVPGLAEKRPSLIKGDRLYASCDADRETEFEGYVHEIQQTGVWLKFSERSACTLTRRQGRLYLLYLAKTSCRTIN